MHRSVCAPAIIAAAAIAICGACCGVSAQDCDAISIEPENLPSEGLAVATGDYDDDGLIDAVVLDRMGIVSRFRGDGLDSLSSAGLFAQSLAPGGVRGDIELADVNNDGYPDIIATIEGPTPQMVVYLNNRMGGPGGGGPGVFQGATFYDTTRGTYDDLRMSEIAVGDYNGDGLADIAVCSPFSIAMGIFEGTGGGAFAPMQLHDDLQPVFNSQLSHPSGVVTATAPSGGTTILTAGDVAFLGATTTFGEIVYNDASGVYEYHELLDDGTPFTDNRQLNGADINGDGVTDLIMRYASAPGGPSIYKVYQRQTVTPFGLTLIDTGLAPCLNCNVGPAMASYVDHMAQTIIEDFDNDGTLDLLFPGAPTGIAWGEPGGWGDAVPFDSAVVDFNSIDIALEDLDGDGDLEVISIEPMQQLEVRGYDCAQPPVACLADTNGDGLLNPADFNAWILAFNTQSPACDQNGDGLCDPSDFNAWILNFNAGC